VKVTIAEIPGVLIVEPRTFADARGSFGEVFRADKYATFGIDEVFVQDNTSFSKRGVLRGLHFQHPHGQAKLVYALRGEIFDVVVDVRVGSPTFGRSVCTNLSSENRRQIYVPMGFAHGFVVLSDDALVEYKCSDYYSPETERGLRWDDPDLDIDWPVAAPLLSLKDAAAPLLRDIARNHLPHVGD
jgi:dTDP-4-dehydrorhamnose 3,5-epimerase